MTGPAITASAALHTASHPHGWQMLMAFGLLGVGAASCSSAGLPADRTSGAAASGDSATGAAGTAAPAAAAITEIEIERGCFGCATGTSLVLRHDGTALYTVTGNARHGTADRRSRASIAVADFDRLARQALQQGFFNWQDSYQDPRLQDGAWTVVRLRRGEQVRQVFERNGAGPQGFATLAQAIDAWKVAAAFEPAP
ncbi:MAG: hypothetical protein ABIN96_02500 [Rubrivivax sp.]